MNKRGEGNPIFEAAILGAAGVLMLILAFPVLEVFVSYGVSQSNDAGAIFWMRGIVIFFFICIILAILKIARGSGD